jgi:hypothetical protein
MLGLKELPLNDPLKGMDQKAVIGQAFLRGVFQECISSVALQAVAE